MAKLRTWLQRGAHAGRDHRGQQGLPGRRRDPDLRRLVAAAGAGRVQAPASATTSTRRWSTPCRSTSRRPAASTGRRLRPAHLGERGAGPQGLLVPVRLVGLRRQGPARGARRHRGRAGRRSTAAAAPWPPAAPRCCPACRRRLGRAGHHHLPRRRLLRGRRPVVRRRDRAVAARRHQARPDRLAEPADLPAGGLVPGQARRRHDQPGRRAGPATASSTQSATRRQRGRRQPDQPLGQLVGRQPVATGRPGRARSRSPG